MHPIVFTDLDDTLFQTKWKCPDVHPSDLKVMSRLVDGSTSGLATPVQQNFLGWLEMGDVIPVTARSSEVLARVEINQAPAVVANGGSILTHTGIDQKWHRHLVDQSAQSSSVADFHALLGSKVDNEAYRYWIVSENDLPLYVVIKSNGDDASVLSDVAAEMDLLKPAGWRTHLNGNNLAFLPEWLNKRHAVEYLIANARAKDPSRPIIGVGDSHSDVGFMDLCDFAMAPTRSQLWKAVTAENEWVE